MRLFRLGDFFVKQVVGIPTGVPLSSYILDMTLSFLEYKYDQQYPSRKSETACGRYADDIILASLFLCSGCLWSRVGLVYKGAVSFSRVDEFKLVRSTHVQKYLDFQLHISFDSCRVALVHPDKLYAVTGDDQNRSKHNTTLYTTLSRSLLASLRAEVKREIAWMESCQSMSVEPCCVYFS